MSTYRLDRLFAPASVAVVGASERETSLGHAVFENLRRGGFAGPVYPVNPRYSAISGIPCFASLRGLERAPDVVVIAAPPVAVPAIVFEAGACGAACAVILTAGLGHGQGSIAEGVAHEARRTGLRIVGPNCLGVLAPRAKFNASFAASLPTVGGLAVISQSGAVAAALIEWSAQRRTGFSGLVSLGDMADVDIADCLDYFAQDINTRAILLYVEAVGDARKFLSAARVAARAKPVIVMKAGRHAQGVKAAATHTGALAGSDAVYDAAFRHAGLIRVFDLEELFAAAEILAYEKPVDGERLAILTNGGGLGVLAVDRLADYAGHPAEISPAALSALNGVLPASWSRANPVDIIGDATPERYARALDILINDSANDAILVMNCQTAMASSKDAAQAVVAAIAKHRVNTPRPKPVMAVWYGASAEVTQIFETAAIPNFAGEAEAIRSFTHLVSYRRAQEELMQQPPQFAPVSGDRRKLAFAIVDSALRDDRVWLDPSEASRLLSAYDIETIPVVIAGGPDAAADAARPFVERGESCAVKIHSRDIPHKSDIGGVALNLKTVEAVRQAASDIMARAKALRPDARTEGVMVQPMIVRPNGYELLLGVVDDPTFGPVIAFGAGGTAVEILDDKALALPPLDLRLARDLIGRTRIARLLQAWRNRPAANCDAIAAMLVRLSQLAADLPHITGIDLNPVLADENTATALDARIGISAAGALPQGKANPRFSIRPYPAEWARTLTLDDGQTINVRPLRPEDAPLFAPFFASTSAADLRLRFFAPVKNPNHAFIARLTQLDYARSMAFAAIDPDTGALAGVVRLHGDANHDKGEYAILVRSDLKGRGLGWKLMQLILDYARADGYDRLEGQVLAENTAMLAMCAEFGFSIADDAGDLDIKIVRLKFDKTKQAPELPSRA